MNNEYHANAVNCVAIICSVMNFSCFKYFKPKVGTFYLVDIQRKVLGVFIQSVVVIHAELTDYWIFYVM